MGGVWVNLKKNVDYLVGVEADDFGQSQKLHHVQPTLSILDVGDERLMPPECLGNGGLCQSGLLSLLGQQGSQTDMPFRMK